MHYDQPNETTLALIQSTIKEFHPELEEAVLNIDMLIDSPTER